MKILYLECAMGAAGDMLMAALLDLYPDAEGFLAQMNALGLPGVSVRASEAASRGQRGRRVSVCVHGQAEEAPVGHTHAHDHDHHHNHDHSHVDSKYPVTLQTIDGILSGLPLDEEAKNHARAVYKTLAEAESWVHGEPLSQLHFHEVGTLDAVADVVGVCLLMALLKPDRVVVSPVAVGSGTVSTAHGLLPVPAPATAELLRGAPIRGGDISGELCTPTGAALLTHFADEYGTLPSMQLTAVGVGLGTREFDRPNCLRAFLGEAERPSADAVAEISCNVDDMTGEALAFAMERLLENGALDAFTLPAMMKKGRPGYVLTCLCRPEDLDKMQTLMLQNTQTLGVRCQIKDRRILARSSVTVQTPYGPVRVKISTGYGVNRAKPEYEDVAALARAGNLPFDMVRDAALEALLSE